MICACRVLVDAVYLKRCLIISLGLSGLTGSVLLNIIAAELLDGDQRLIRMKALKFKCNMLILHG